MNEKKFVAFATSGNHKSSIDSFTNVQAWGRKLMTVHQNVNQIHIAEVTHVMERTEPAVALTAFKPAEPAGAGITETA